MAHAHVLARILLTHPPLHTSHCVPVQGFYAALRLVSVCQLGKEPSLAVVTLSDPPPRLLGLDSNTIAGLAQKKWTIEVHIHVCMCTAL